MVVAVQQHTIFLEFIPVPILRGILRPAEPQARTGTGCHTQRVMPSLFSPPSKRAALEQAHAPGQQCESGLAPSVLTRAALSTCVLPSFIHLLPLGHDRVLFLRVHARGLWRNVESLQARASHQPKPPCFLAQSISSDFSVHLYCGARAFCPPREEEKKRGS